MAGSLIIDYHKVAGSIPVEQYVREVIAGQRFDSNLSKQLHKGFEVHGLIPNYTNCETSANWGVEIVWKNPDYQHHPARALSRMYAFMFKSPFMPQGV